MGKDAISTAINQIHTLSIRLLITGIVFMILVSESCTQARKHIPDVSKIVVHVHIDRFDQQFMSIDSTHILRGLGQLNKRFPVFTDIYLEDILNYGPYSDTSTILRKEVHAFITARDIRNLQKTVDTQYSESGLNSLKQELTRGFQFLKYYLPSYHTPRIVTFISGLNNFGAVTADSVLAIGLDMFLGKDFPPYQQISDPYPDYMLATFSRPYIVPDCFKAIEQQLYPIPEQGTLLDQIIAYGKQLYFLDQVLPDTPDSLKIQYSSVQLDWCKQNERFIWQFFIQNNLLYSTDMQQIMHYVGPGPSTQGMPKEAPGNIGSWIGWRIVKMYMKKHPQISLHELLEDTDSQKILREASYKP